MPSTMMLVIGFLLLLLSPVFAQGEHEKNLLFHGSDPQCSIPSTAQDVVICAREHHINVKRARLGLEPADAFASIAKQISNPELQTRTTFGASKGSLIAQSENAILQTIELGGKRKARIEEAQSQKKQVESEVLLAEAKATTETVLKLHRLRLLARELVIINDTIKAYSELISQIKSRSTRSSEQEVTLGIYEMALSDAVLKEAGLQDEEREIGHFFHVNAGLDLSAVKAVLPPSLESWPVVQDAPLSSPELTRLKADRELALAQLGSAKASAWPNLTLGPAYILNLGDNGVQHLFGLQLSIPLPLFQTNQGGRAYAQKLITKADESIALTIAEDTHERTERVNTYNAAVLALKKTMTSTQIESRYQKMKDSLPRGLIPSPLIMEAHRQRYDAEQSRNEFEFKAIKALWEIYQFDGRIFEVSI